jgi:hypothetical protein
MELVGFCTAVVLLLQDAAVLLVVFTAALDVELLLAADAAAMLMLNSPPALLPWTVAHSLNMSKAIPVVITTMPDNLNAICGSRWTVCSSCFMQDSSSDRSAELLLLSVAYGRRLVRSSGSSCAGACLSN